MLKTRILLMLLLCGLFAGVQAHEVRPGYLELREVDTRSWDVLWKVPARDTQRLGLYVQMPGDCTDGASGARLVNGAYIERWRTSCADGLVGRGRHAVNWPRPRMSCRTLSSSP